MPADTRLVRLTVIAADGLYKKDLFKLPDPFGKNDAAVRIAEYFMGPSVRLLLYNSRGNSRR
jgi:hypothetical protein